MHNRFRNNDRTLNIIHSMLEENKISSSFRKNLSVKLKQFLQEKIEELDRNAESHIQQYEEIKWAMIFIELYEDKLNDM